MPFFNPTPLLEVLAGHEVAFVVVGQSAAVLHGTPASTADLDITPARTPDNAGRLATALATVHARRLVTGRRPAEWPLVCDADFTGWRLVSYLTDHGRVDVVPRVRAAGEYEELAARARPLLIGGREVRVAALDDVIASKEALGRVRDRDQLPTLYAARERLETHEAGNGGHRGPASERRGARLRDPARRPDEDGLA